MSSRRKGVVGMFKRVIIDTDTAGDDNLAILLALAQNHWTVEGVTIVGGNIQFDQQVENALYTIELAGKSGQVPVYKGHSVPYHSFGDIHHQTVEEVHGEDGMGNSFFPSATQRPEPGHAVDFIIEKIHQYPGEILLFCIAPLTNIAMALKKDPFIASKIRHIYIMGGTNNSLGNITPAAEYNFWVDPEAARIVLHSGAPITMVGWEMCTRYAMLDEEDHQEIIRLQTRFSQFFTAINQVVMKFNREVHQLNGTSHPDTLLVAVAANEQIMTQFNNYYVDVETHGILTRGYSLVDINHRLGKKKNVRVCEGIDRSAFKEMILTVLDS